MIPGNHHIEPKEIPLLHTRICDLFGIEHPIISAPMGGSAGAALAGAVSMAGGLGMIGGSTAGPEWLQEQIESVRRQTSNPFGVGFITSAPDTAQLMDVALEHRVPVISHAFVDASEHIYLAREQGIKTIVQVQTVAQAVAAVKAGADAIAAQGMEAGGHTGNHSAVLPLVPAIIDAVGDVPVVAAGGIADGRGLAAVLMLGAEGAWMGTRFVASLESFTVDWIKQRITESTGDDLVLTRVYDVITEAPFPEVIWERVMRNDFTDLWQGREAELGAYRDELRSDTSAAHDAADASIAKAAAGNSAGLVHSIEPAAEIVRRVVEEAAAILRTRPGSMLR